MSISISENLGGSFQDYCLKFVSIVSIHVPAYPGWMAGPTRRLFSANRPVSQKKKWYSLKFG